MLPLEKCRKILGSNCNLTDSELELLRDQLYSLADISIGLYRQRAKLGGTSNESGHLLQGKHKGTNTES